MLGGVDQYPKPFSTCSNMFIVGQMSPPDQQHSKARLLHDDSFYLNSSNGVDHVQHSDSQPREV